MNDAMNDRIDAMGRKSAIDHFFEEACQQNECGNNYKIVITLMEIKGQFQLDRLERHRLVMK